MDITATVNLDDAEASALDRQLEVARVSNPELTANALASHLLRKLLTKWKDDERAKFVVTNRDVIDDVVTTLATDPERQTKLDALGLSLGTDGKLTRKGTR